MVASEVEYSIPMKLIGQIFSLIILPLSLASPAQAKPHLIIPPPSPEMYDRATNNVLEAIFSHFNADQRLTVVNKKAVSEHLRKKMKSDESSLASRKDIKRAENLLSEGWRDYKALKIGSAIKKLERAKAEFRKLLRSLPTYHKLLTCYLHLGIAYMAEGKKSRGEQEIREMIILDPLRQSRKLKKTYYSPSTVKAHDDLRKQLLAATDNRVVFEVTPPNASLWLDGQKINGTLVKNVPEGEHYIKARMPGYEPMFFTKFVVNGENRINIQLQQQSSVTTIADHFKPTPNAFSLSQETTGFLDQLSIKFDGDIVFLFHVTKNEKGEPTSVEGQLYDQRNQVVSNIQKVAILDANLDVPAKSLVSELVNQINEKGRVALPNSKKNHKKVKKGEINRTLNTRSSDFTAFSDARGKTQKAKLGRPWYKKWWVYGAIVGGAVIVTSSLFLFTDTFDAAPTTNSFSINNPRTLAGP